MPAKTDHKLLTIGQLSKKLGVSISTLRRWDKSGKLKALRTAGNQRRYKLHQYNKIFSESQSTKISLSGTTRDKLASSYTINNIPSARPQLFLYAVMTAIITIQILHLTIVNIPSLRSLIESSARITVLATRFYSQPQNQPQFNNAALVGSLYTATLHYQHFAKGFNYTISLASNTFKSTSQSTISTVIKGFKLAQYEAPIRRKQNPSEAPLSRAKGDESETSKVLGSQTFKPVPFLLRM